MIDLSFFKLSKILWWLAAPDAILVILLLSGCLLLWLKAYKKTRFLLTILSVLILGITIFPVGVWLLYPLEKRFMPVEQVAEPVDGIIMLGGAEHILESLAWRQAEMGEESERFFAFISLLKKHPTAKKVYSGGTGSVEHQEFKGSETAKRLLASQGLDVSGIIFESQSKNTYENGLYSKRLIRPEPGEKWILVTSALHMPRAYGVFLKLGWQITPYPVDHLTNPDDLFYLTFNFSGNIGLLKTAIHEWVGLAAYYLTGKTSHFFPKPAES